MVFLPRMLSGDGPTYTLATEGPGLGGRAGTARRAGEAADFEVEYLALGDAPAVEDAVRQGTPRSGWRTT